MKKYDLTIDSFDPEIYGKSSQDLRNLNLSTDELVAHFYSYGIKERRKFSIHKSQSESFSHIYLRGHGIEIGAGASPTILMESVNCDYGDIAHDGLFDSYSLKLDKKIIDINKIENVDPKLVAKYDFVIASHVLEHCDSLVRSLKALRKLSKPGGIIYVVLPDSSHDNDGALLKKHGVAHHFIEYYFPNIFLKKHRNNFLRSVDFVKSDNNITSKEGNAPVGILRSAILNNHIPMEYDYIFHRHSYEYKDWITLILKLNNYFKIGLRLIDSGFGHERNDAHFIFEVN
jgi:SAM-dependent methyltransferase